MTGILPRRRILWDIPYIARIYRLHSLQSATPERVCNITYLQESLHEMHEDVQQLISDRRRPAIEAHNSSANIVTPNFIVGDFVVISKPTRPAHKLSFRWFGPRRVVSVKRNSVCIVEKFLTQKRETVHVARMK